MITIPPIAHLHPVGQQQLRQAAAETPPRFHRTTQPFIYFLGRLAVGDWQTNSHYHEVQRLAYAIIRAARAARPIDSSFVLYQRLMRGALIATAGERLAGNVGVTRCPEATSVLPCRQDCWRWVRAECSARCGRQSLQNRPHPEQASISILRYLPIYLSGILRAESS